jgi:hypothetical protein
MYKLPARGFSYGLRICYFPIITISQGSHNYVANFQGPLIPVKVSSSTDIELVATHQDANATLGLTGSAQKVALDMSVVPNKVSGEASFFSADGKDILHGTTYIPHFQDHLTRLSRNYLNAYSRRLCADIGTNR